MNSTHKLTHQHNEKNTTPSRRSRLSQQAKQALFATFLATAPLSEQALADNHDSTKNKQESPSEMIAHQEGVKNAKAISYYQQIGSEFTLEKPEFPQTNFAQHRINNAQDHLYSEEYDASQRDHVFMNKIITNSEEANQMLKEHESLLPPNMDLSAASSIMMTETGYQWTNKGGRWQVTNAIPDNMGADPAGHPTKYLPFFMKPEVQKELKNMGITITPENFVSMIKRIKKRQLFKKNPRLNTLFALANFHVLYENTTPSAITRECYNSVPTVRAGFHHNAKSYIKQQLINKGIPFHTSKINVALQRLHRDPALQTQRYYAQKHNGHFKSYGAVVILMKLLFVEETMGQASRDHQRDWDKYKADYQSRQETKELRTKGKELTKKTYTLTTQDIANIQDETLNHTSTTPITTKNQLRENNRYPNSPEQENQTNTSSIQRTTRDEQENISQQGDMLPPAQLQVLGSLQTGKGNLQKQIANLIHQYHQITDSKTPKSKATKLAKKIIKANNEHFDKTKRTISTGNQIFLHEGKELRFMDAERVVMRYSLTDQKLIYGNVKR